MNKNIKLKEILKINDEQEVYTKATITGITSKISKKGFAFYFIEIADELKTITVCLSPEYFEQEIKIYAHEPITDDELKPKYKINDMRMTVKWATNCGDIRPPHLEIFSVISFYHKVAGC